MSKGLRIGLIVGGGLVVAGLLVTAGVALGGLVWGWPSGAAQAAWGPAMMGAAWRDGVRGGMMGGGYGGMMGGGRGYGGMMGGGYGGMMGGSSALGVDPLTIEQAESAVEGYLQGLGNDDLSLGEVMIFDNHAYAQLVEVSTGLGAMEVLVDPRSLTVYPEPGPNMMWNLKYGHMSGFGPMGAMMGGWWNAPESSTATAEMPLTAEEAIEAAQAYLDRVGDGLEAEAHADPFYGYYTLHIGRDGKVVGMLSVNGFSGEVFVHTWHGNFVEMAEVHAE